ncbi:MULTISPECIES: helix-turn-helix domain-containing protein [Serratia]|nr:MULTISPECIES: helix-turn-helix domain-containing protein [Serratia]MCI2401946.1 helix-turn-helix domain-containing protein [Serratia sp. PGPR-27]MDP8859741.1 helix-turn-helix domain-containing protein [Serratia marcescens]MDY7606293.1 helix-turn-helix domain-containing protein [Serratia marcescens]QPJ91338.1 helix-turn-helix domain-containing protein [Serratia marcescens]UTL88432.1 helix-turn-helix domain-containing protein [Serratia marcescens]
MERAGWIRHYRQIKKLSIRETADATGCSTSQVCRIQAFYKEVETD